MVEDTFWAAIRILRATAQGVQHSNTCDWQDENVCEECKKVKINFFFFSSN